ncbi:MAG TPA: hypothetical protein VNJ02_14235 [Vicinamibacterales bacterium]|nr:hypothetical protein [Vicinamibacterales bacterium]
MPTVTSLTRRASRMVALAALALIVAQSQGHAQAQPQIAFESGWEGDVWHALPKIGHPIACAPVPDYGGTLGECEDDITPETLRYPIDVALFYQNPPEFDANGVPVNPLAFASTCPIS